MNKNTSAKKSILKNTIQGGALICMAILLTIPLSFTSCKNFLDAQEAQNEIIDAIAYNNAKDISVSISCKEEMGTVFPENTYTGKLGYEFELQFIPNTKNYTIIDPNKIFEAVSRKDNSISRADCVVFSHVEQTAADKRDGLYRTKVKVINDTGDILFRPDSKSCVLVPKIKSVLPLNDNKGCDQDTIIEVSFNKPITPSSFDNFSCISIFAGETDLKEYFNTPVFSNDQTTLYITPKGKDKLILTPDSGQTLDITVTIDLKNVKDCNNLSIESNIEHTYKINDNFGNQKVAKILVNASASQGSFLTAGETECTVGYTIDLQFTVNQDEYSFDGLEAVSKESGESRDDCVAFTTTSSDSINGVYKITATIIKDTGDILIRPVLTAIPKAKVNITGSNGKFSPAKGEQTAYKDRINQISFEPDSDYEFIKWEVYNENSSANTSNVNLADYIEIDDATSGTTTYTLKNKPDDSIKLAIRAVVLERPQIISATPLYDSRGAYRDSRIQVMFDCAMDLDCIYFTDDEIGELEKQSGLVFLPDVNIGTESAPDLRKYGYTLNGTIVFKNIQIINKKNGTNLLEFFEGPQFDSTRTRLTIAPKKSKLPPSGTTILVTIDKNFSFSIQEQKKIDVKLRESKKWVYYINSDTDKTPPAISSVEIRDMEDNLVKTTAGQYSFLNQEKKLKFRISVTDFDSGPATYFDLVLQKLSANGENEGEEFTAPVYFEQQEAGYASCGNANDVIDANNPPTYYVYCIDKIPDDDGNYKFYLKAYDNSGLSTDYKEKVNNVLTKIYYYISLDTTAPVISTRTVDTCDDSEHPSKTGITFTYQCEDADLAEAKLYYRPAISTSAANWDDWSDATLVPLTKTTAETTKEITGLDYGQTYEIKVDFFDNAKNLTSYLFKKRTLPEEYSGITPEVNEHARCIKIDANHYALGADEVVLSYKNNRDSDYTTVSYDDFTDGVFYIRNIDHASTYDIKLNTKNSESVTEECYENKGLEKENVFESSWTFDTRPLRFNRITNSSKVEDGKYKYTFKAENSFKEYSGGVKYTYAKYNDNGVLGAQTTDTWDNLTMVHDNENRITQFPALYFDLNCHYYIKFEPYYKNSDNQKIYCLPENSIDYDFWTATTQTIPAVSNIQIVNITATTATVTWEINDTVPFENYKLVLKKNSTEMGKVIIPNTATSFTITGLDKRLTSPAQYQVSVTRHAEDGSTSPSVSTEKFAVKADVEPGISNMSPDAPSDNKSIKFKSGSQFIAKSGTSYNNLNNRCTYDSNTQCFIVSDSSSDENQTYYIRLYNDDNEPVSKMFAIRAPYKKGTNSNASYYCLSSFSYEVNTKVTTDNVTLKWNWKDNNYPAETFNIYYREVGTSGWTSATSGGFTKTKTQQKITLAQGKDYDIRFGGNSAVSPANGYAAGYVSVPMATTNFIPQSDSKTSNSVVLKWNSAPSTTIFDWYNVYEVSGTSPMLVKDHINKSVTSTELTLLESNTTYKYIVCYHRVGDADNTTSSTNLQITTLPETEIVNTDLPLVSNLKLDSRDPYSSDPYYVKWSSLGDDYSYKVSYKKASASTWTTSDVIATNNYLLPDLSSGTQYQVRVYSVKDGEQSNPAELKFYTQPDAVVLGDSEITSTSITLNWTNPTSKYSKILVYYIKNGYDYYLEQFDSSNPKTTVTLEDLEPDTSYTFKITSVAGNDEHYVPEINTVSVVCKTLE